VPIEHPRPHPTHVRALTVEPGVANSARVEEVSAPQVSNNDLLIRAIAMGVCGTDIEIVEGLYGAAPEGRRRLVLGHESLGEVLAAPPDSGFSVGDRVVGIVRHPDPEPCASCAAGEWDMCQNGLFKEHGISGLDGFGSELFTLDPDFAVKVDPALGYAGVLLEPASVVAKAWEQIDRIGSRLAAWSPRVALVTGAGPVGLLAALLGVQRNLDVHVFDRVADGPKPALVRAMGAHYHSGNLAELELSPRPDVVIECTGASTVVLDALSRTRRNGIVCLTGISSGTRTLAVNLTDINRGLVLENDCVFGSVNANKRHYEAAAAALSAAPREWLSRLITRRVPVLDFEAALKKRPDDVKVVIDFAC
jgi:threonine dehydrogenase-like Zn-dependent dehydrogenase